MKKELQRIVDFTNRECVTGRFKPILPDIVTELTIGLKEDSWISLMNRKNEWKKREV